MDVKIGALGKGCFPAVCDRDNGWGSPMLPTSSAVRSFRAVSAMWKYCWYSKWSKQCCRQTLGTFMRWYWHLGRSGPHGQAVKIHLLCCWAPLGRCNSGIFEQETSEQILAVCCRDHGPWDTEGAARSLYIISLCLQPQNYGANVLSD